MNDGLLIGLISGTSRDGIDAALVEFNHGRPNLLHALCLPYHEPLKSDLDELLASGLRPAPARYAKLDEMLGRHFARAARTLAGQAGIEMRDLTAIGSHGQTIWHEPVGPDRCSIQLGDPRVLVRSTRTTVVCNFRNADLAAGGQGAPLAPLLHRELFFNAAENRAVLNLGGIANVTFLNSGGAISGFDTGPANCLLDLWARTHRGEAFDEAGAWAASGKLLEGLLETMLADPYFPRPPPKSTGLEYFNQNWLHRYLQGPEAAPEDVQCTLAELTVRSVAAALALGGPPPARLLVCGGGVRNTDLMSRLSGALPETIVESTARHGVNPDWVEAILFAWLARERLRERKLDTRRITGARRAVLLGDVHRP